MADERDKQPQESLRESQSPGGEGFPDHPEQLASERDRSVSGDEAEEAADRALEDEPLSRREILEQSAYRGHEADAGQQAADAERGEGAPAERKYPKEPNP